ncbi:MAG: single-stranded DNA-binding protein [Chloroflexi bacterium]|nr:single-stranded DNA-binding protein [Chloroflexota bacterium]
MAWHQTIIIGNVGRNPELRYLQSGTAVCDFSVAVSESWTDSSTNERREKTTWYRVSAWGRLGEICNQYLEKGRQVMVVGTVEARAYTDKSGQPAASLDLRARDVRFLGSRADREGGSGNGGYEDFAPPPQSGNVDDIPF